MAGGAVMTVLGPRPSRTLGVVDAHDHLFLGGGPGMGYLLDIIVPRLRRRIGDTATDAILVDNPARAFTMAPILEPVA